MPQKIIRVPKVGDILIVKSRKSRSIRLSIAPSGRIRVSQPYWAPYATGASFARRKAAWIKQQLDIHQPTLLEDEMRIGKSHVLRFIKLSGGVNTKISETEIIIPIYPGMRPAAIQEKALAACEKALKAEANGLLLRRHQELADFHGFSIKA